MEHFLYPYHSQQKEIYIAFEVQEPLALQLEFNVFINDLKNFAIYNVAIGNPSNFRETIEVSDLDYKEEYKDSHLGGVSLIKEFNSKIKTKFSEKNINKYKKVPLKKIDSYLIKNVDLIKIDVEGMELDVLKGMEQTLINNKYPAILFEAWQEEDKKEHVKKVFEHLDTLGYKDIQKCNGLDYLATHPLRKK